MSRFAVILPAAGRSSRFGRDKLLEPLHGTCVFLHTLRAFAARDDVGEIVVPSASDELRRIALHPKLRFCAGGDTRAQSVRSALQCLDDSTEWVAIHDGARPLVSQELITRTLAAALEHGAAAPALAVHLTIKQAAGPLPARVQRTVARHDLWAMQTPQIARRTDLLEAFERCPLPLDQITDDLQPLELAGREVWIVEGEQRNIKITTPLDLRLAEWLMHSCTVNE